VCCTKKSYGGDKCDGTVKAPSVTAFPKLAVSSAVTSIVAVDRHSDGLKVVTIKRPHPCEPRAKIGDIITVQFTQRQYSKGGEPVWHKTEGTRTFKLGSSDVISGVTQGLTGACTGEVLHLTVPPALAYGALGLHSGSMDIPGNSTIGFEIHVRKLLVSGTKSPTPAPTSDDDNQVDDDGETPTAGGAHRVVIAAPNMANSGW
jgi:hypothetical protein